MKSKQCKIWSLRNCSMPIRKKKTSTFQYLETSVYQPCDVFLLLAWWEILRDIHRKSKDRQNQSYFQRTNAANQNSRVNCGISIIQQKLQFFFTESILVCNNHQLFKTADKLKLIGNTNLKLHISREYDYIYWRKQSFRNKIKKSFTSALLFKSSLTCEFLSLNLIQKKLQVNSSFFLSFYKQIKFFFNQTPK